MWKFLGKFLVLSRIIIRLFGNADLSNGIEKFLPGILFICFKYCKFLYFQFSVSLITFTTGSLNSVLVMCIISNKNTS